MSGVNRMVHVSNMKVKFCYWFVVTVEFDQLFCFWKNKTSTSNSPFMRPCQGKFRQATRAEK